MEFPLSVTAGIAKYLSSGNARGEGGYTAERQLMGAGREEWWLMDGGKFVGSMYLQAPS